ncbi:MAG: alpha/beta fold hydrolase [Mariniblastus sp.]|nr:alpha/beta fold hydrolase [Mariniblastus sp.]
MIRHRSKRRYAFGLLACAVLIVCAGCRSHEKKRAIWNPPLPVAPKKQEVRPPGAISESLSDLSFAESTYAQARKLEKQGSPSCVDYYFYTLQNVWPIIEQQLLTASCPHGRAGALYRSASNQLITAGQKLGRFDPRVGLQVRSGDQWQTIPTTYTGFPWEPYQFDHVVPVGSYSTKDLNEFFRCAGVGVSTVVIRCREPGEQFMRKQQYFAATMLVRPSAETNDQFRIEFINPINHSKVEIAGCSVPLKRDLSAPIVYRIKDEGKQYIEAFLQPGSTKNTHGLFMIQPYQPGKIPLVFVHGLLSDPLTWANVANEMLARPDLMEKYQIWVFEYATGEPFLKSAAVLRQDLQQAMQQIDPSNQDPALDQTVLIGHSMGGLVAQLQVTYSGNHLWRAVSRCPIEQLRIEPDLANRLVKSFYFNPSPQVAKVIYIATPHHGSPWANRLIGRIGSRLVEEPSRQVGEHQQLINDNPGNFSREFRRRIPTSIDLLKPQSPLLEAMSRLETKPSVQFHSIIGIYRPMIGAWMSDGVVPVRSAAIPDVETEKRIHAKHEKINKTPECINELFCILRSHFNQIDFMPAEPESETREPGIAPGEPPTGVGATSGKPAFTVQPIVEAPADLFRDPDLATTSGLPESARPNENRDVP